MGKLPLPIKNMSKQNQAFNLVELIVVVAFITMLSVLSLSALTGARSKALRIACISNLKQVGLAFRTWGLSHNGNLPQTLAASQGGDADDVGVRIAGTTQQSSRGVSKMFLCMSTELGTPSILFCPAEYESSYRQAATSFSGFTMSGTVPYINDLNVSYFIGVDPQEPRPRMFLAGDHNLGGNANPPSTAFFAAPSYFSPSYAVWLGTNWTANMGPAFMANQHNQQGSVLLTDGSVEWFTRSQLQNALKNTGDTMHQPGQFQPATGATGVMGYNRIQLP
jgi:competence protein ComGC